MEVHSDNPLSNPLIVTHYDLDGFVCALTLIEGLGVATSRVRFLSYSANRDRIIESGIEESGADSVIVCDIGLSERDLSAPWATDPNLYRVLFDHHDSTERLDRSAFNQCHLEVEGEVCSADLVFQFVAERFPERATDKLRAWVDVARDRDLWLNRTRQMGQRISWLLKERIHERLDTAIRTSSPDGFLEKLNGNWRRAENLFRDAVELGRNTAHLFTDAPIPVKIAYVKRDTSDVADALQDGNQLVVLLNLFGQDVGISLRTDRSDLDVSRIAHSCFGGGGHRYAASGFAKREHIVGGFDAVFRAIVPMIEEQLAEAEGAAADPQS
jgi:oligoribonuclease NrnB/cAMP/cGMP phosphodiesterase (DHH superfamily)